MAIRIAGDHGIPVFNLGSMSPRAVCERLDAIRPGRLRIVEVESSACRANARQGWRKSPRADAGQGNRQRRPPMFLSPFDPGYDFEPPTGSALLAELGVDRRTVREVGEDDRAIRCPDRDLGAARPPRGSPRRPHALRAGAARGGTPGSSRPQSGAPARLRGVRGGLEKSERRGSGEWSRSPTFVTHRHHPVHEGDTPWHSVSTESN